MSDDLKCPHGFPNRGSCIECMYEGPVAEPERWEKVAGPFSAAYDSLCIHGCGKDIDQGQQIQRYDRGDDTAYIHARCTIVT